MRRAPIRLALATTVSGIATGCFAAPSLLGQPCGADRDCDPRQRCREHVCVEGETSLDLESSETSTTLREPTAETHRASEDADGADPSLDAWLCSGAADADTNLTRNASFEAWAAPDQPLYWHTSAAGVERDAAYPFSGNAALRVGDLTSGVWQTLAGPFRAGTVFEVRAAVRWERGDPPSAVSITVTWDETWGVDGEVQVLGTGHWNRGAFRFRLPLDATWIDLEVDCFFQCGDTPPVVVLDDIEMIVCEAPR